ncbi:MAG: nSTAND1 domain-containing NTPase [Thainema sp.]
MSRDAVVVGINGYQYLPSLTAPAQDAEAIATQLQQYGEFRVHRLPEVIQDGKPIIGTRTAITVQDLESALVQLFKPKGRNIPETALFYFSGHGIQKDAGIQEGFLATSDVNPQVGFYGLSLFWLRRLLQESPVRQRVVILDCCHSGELLNLLEADPGARAGTDRLFMAASREYESAFESLNSPYSVFTQALVSGLDPTQSTTGIITNHALISSVNDQLKGELQQPLFESSGSEIVLTRTHQVAQRVCAVQDSEEQCPYPGAEPFQTHQADLFWGRKTLTQQLVTAVRQNNCCILTGASASGKTSVVQAGLIPALQHEQTTEGCDRWQIKTVNLSGHPVKNLAHAFLDSTQTELERAEQLRRVETFLEDGGRGLNQLIQASLLSPFSTFTLPVQAQQAENRSNQRFLLVIDHIEQLFTHSRGAKAEQERQRFFDCLQEAIAYNQQLHVLLVVRTDILERLADYGDLMQAVGQNLLRVQPMTYEDLKATVVKPAEKIGLHCEPNLIYTLLLDVVGTSADLALLQQVLVELWQHRQTNPDTQQSSLTLDAYTEIGGIRTIIQRQASKVYAQLSPKEQTAVRRIFLALTQLGEGTEDSRRRILKSELVSTGFSNDLIEHVLEKLVAARVVVVDKIMTGDAAYVDPQMRASNMSTALRLAQRSQGKFTALNATLKLPNTRPSGFWSCRSRWASNEDGSSQDLLPLAEAKFSAVSPTASPRFSQAGSSDSTQLLNLKSASCPTSTKDKNWIQKPSESLVTLLSGHSPDAWSTTVDAVHEALIRHWPVLRQWLEEERENLRCQRRIERAAREWERLGCPEEATYLLHGHRLREAEEYLKQRAEELSTAAHTLIERSQQEIRKVRKENWLMQLSIPCTLLLALGLSFSQYRLNLSAQAEQEHQRQIAASRQWAAIAQTVLEDPQSDPNAALLISRLAAEQGAHTYEAQASLRAALQEMRLRAQLNDHDAAVHQLVFSPDQQHFASTSVDGSVRLWGALNPTVPDGRISSIEVLPPRSEESADSSESMATQLAFSPNGEWLAIAHHDSTDIQIWSIKNRKIFHRLSNPSSDLQQLAFSADGQWLLGQSNSEVKLWHVENPTSIRISSDIPLQSVELSSSGNKLLLATQNGQLTLWKFVEGIQLIEQQQDQQDQSDAEQNTTEPDEDEATEDKATLNQPPNISLTLQTLRDPDHPLAASVQQLVQTAPINNATLSPDAQWVATSGTDGNVRLWQLETGQIQHTMPQIDHYAASDYAASDEDASATNTSESTVNQLLPVQQVIFSPNSQFLASIGPDQQIWIWQPELGLLHTQLPTDPSTPLTSNNQRSTATQEQFLQFSPDGQRLATLHAASTEQSDQPFIQLWHIETGEKERSIQPRQDVISSFQFTPDGSHLATTATDGQIQLWDLTVGGELPTVQLSEDAEQWFSFASSGQLSGFPEFDRGQSLAMASPQILQIEIVSLKGHQLLQRWNVPIWLADRETPYVTTMAQLHQEKIQASTVSVSPWYTKWQFMITNVFNQAAKRIPIAVLPASSSAGQEAISGPVSLGLTVQTKGTDDVNWQQIASLTEQHTLSTDLSSADLSPDDAAEPAARNLASDQLTSDNAALDDSAPPTPAHDATATEVTATALHPAGTQFAIADQNGIITIYSGLDNLRVYDESQAKEPENSDQGNSAKQPFALPKLESQMVQIENVRRHAENNRQPSLVSSLVYSPDGKTLASINDDLTVRLWDAQSGELRQEFVGHNATILSASFSTDGKHLVTSGWDKTVRIWNIDSGRLLRSLSLADVVSRAVFSPDGQSVVATGWDGLITLFQAETGHEKMSIIGHRGAIVDAAYSPDGSQFATADEDGLIKLWESASGVEQATLSIKDSDQPIERVSFSPDGQFVAALTGDGQIYFWAATWDSLLALARDRSLHPLSAQDCYRYLRLPDNECPTFELNPLAQQ